MIVWTMQKRYFTNYCIPLLTKKIIVPMMYMLALFLPFCTCIDMILPIKTCTVYSHPIHHYLRNKQHRKNQCYTKHSQRAQQTIVYVNIIGKQNTNRCQWYRKNNGSIDTHCYQWRIIELLYLNVTCLKSKEEANYEENPLISQCCS